jgi:hypothetical protein
MSRAVLRCPLRPGAANGSARGRSPLEFGHAYEVLVTRSFDIEAGDAAREPSCCPERAPAAAYTPRAK